MIQPGIDLAGGTKGGNSSPALPVDVSPEVPVLSSEAPVLSSEDTVALSQLPTGSEATLAGDRLPVEDRDMLRAMGLTDRSPVRVCRQGEPCIVQVRTTRVGLSRAIAELLNAVPTPTPSALSPAPLATAT